MSGRRHRTDGGFVEFLQPAAPCGDPHEIRVVTIEFEADRGDGGETVGVIGVVAVNPVRPGGHVVTVEALFPADGPDHIEIIGILDDGIQPGIVGEALGNLPRIPVEDDHASSS